MSTAEFKHTHIHHTFMILHFILTLISSFETSFKICENFHESLDHELDFSIHSKFQTSTKSNLFLYIIE